MEKKPIDIVIRNSFLLWSNILILLLTAMPIFATYISKLSLNSTEWSLPKTYEHLIYVTAMLSILSISVLNKYIPSLLQKDHPRYCTYFIFLYPLMILLYTFIPSDFTKYQAIFILSFLSLGIFCYDIYRGLDQEKPGKNKYSPYLLLASVVLSVFLIFLKSVHNPINLSSFWLIGLFALILFTLQLDNTRLNKHSKYLVWLLPLLLFFLTFYSMSNVTTSNSAIFHYAFFFGPVIEILYGKIHPLLTDNQYGGGLAAFLALYFKLRNSITMEAMQQLLKVLTFVQYLLIYIIAVSLYRSRILAFLALIAILFYNFYTQADFYYMAPSIGFLRFGFIYLILLCYLLEGKILSQKMVFFATSILGSIAFLWSPESAVYTVPALLFTEYTNKNLKRFLPIFFGCFFFIVLAYLSPLMLEGIRPPLERFYEYAMLYGGGFAQAPLPRMTSIWWLFPLLYGFMLIRIVSGYTSNKIVVGLTIYGMTLFTYYGGRALPNNLFHIAIPFILLSFYCIQTLQSPSPFLKRILFSLATIAFLSTTYQWVDTGKMVILGIWEKNLPLAMNTFLPENRQFKTSGVPDPVENRACSYYSPLAKYIENGAISLITEDTLFYQLYACTKTHNAFSANPYMLSAFNPKAIQRITTKADVAAGTYLLVDADLLKNKLDSLGSSLFLQILEKTQAKKVDTFKLGNTTIVVYQKQTSISTDAIKE